MIASGRERQPPIGDYAIIGDCRTAALVSRDGSIDWYCLPRFDGPSVFGGLLDAERGGRFSVRPSGDFTSTRRYLPESNVLETTFRCDGGVLRLTDAMTVPAQDSRPGLFPDHEILRKVECLKGAVAVEVAFDPRFDYGRRSPRLRDLGSVGLQLETGPHVLLLRSEIPLRPADGASGPPLQSGPARLEAGEVRWLSLVSEHGAPAVVCPVGDAAAARLDTTAGWWREWLGGCTYEGPYRDLVHRSMLTLKLLIYPPSGALLAAPTTSLPETPGGVRNWDYRFCWLRDASMTLEVLLGTGFSAEGEAFLGWLLHATRQTRPELRVLYDVHGRAPRDEVTLDHLSGYRGATPVRAGNEAADQLQLDIYGELIRAAWAYVDQGGTLDREQGRLLAGVARTVMKKWNEPDHGIWEVRGPRRQYTQSRAMCYVALDCLLHLHEGGQVSLDDLRDDLLSARDEIRRTVEAEAWSEEVGSYTAWPGTDRMDAALLLLGLAGYHEPGHERLEATRRMVRERLGVEGLLRRYDYDDHLDGREGAFGLCGFWEARLLARQGRVAEAREVFERSASLANDVGLLSEEMDPSTGELLGNFPQAFTHVGLVSAASEIARAEERRSA